MKKIFILVPVIGVLLYVLLSSSSSGPGTVISHNGTGATGTLGCASGSCHATSATSSTTVTMQLLSGTTPVTCYTPGTVYTLKITGTNTSSSSLPRYGFQMAVVKALGAGTGGAVNAGTLGTTPGGTHIISVSGISILEHGSALTSTTGSGGSGTTYVQTINWTAPSPGTGSVVLYGVVNAVNGGGGADAGDWWNTTSVTIGEVPSPISGTLTVCAGLTATLTGGGTGTWASLSTLIATVSATTGVVSGVSAGNATINYTTGCGTVSAIVTVNSVPSNITGSPSVCVGGTTALFSSTPGGTWSTGSPSVASITGSGTSITVNGLTAGTSLISYTSPAGCAATMVVSVNSIPAAITGALNVCQGASVTLSSGSGGTWSSASTGVATVGSSTGVVNGVATGSSPVTAVITYTSAAGCAISATVTVNPVPGAIGGLTTVCPGQTITLTDAVGGGTWSSASTSIATVASGTGVVAGVAPAGGTTLITYALPGGCATTKTITVNPAPAAISGTLELCAGTTTTLSDAGGGTWISGSTGVATIGTAGVVTGVATSGGTSIITYTLPVTGCTTTTVVTVDAAPGTIGGTMSVCPGATTTLTDAGGGTWSSSLPAIGSIDASGIVSGLSPGTTTITYSLPGTGCNTSAIVTVNTLPTVAAITGTLTVCAGATATLSDATAGGVWTINPASLATVGSATGAVVGVAIGFPIVSYTITNGFGCSALVTANVTVNPNPAAITGSTSVCVGSSITLGETASGAWTSNLPGVATVTTPATSSTLAGVSTGVANITYTAPVTGCTATKTITVNPLPGAITGPSSVCIGSVITVGNSVTGGVWSANNANVSVGSASGDVTGVTAGTSIVSYSLSTGCRVTKIVTINSLPAVIGGPSQVCVGAQITLTDAGGGSWTSSNANATVVGGTGIVTGVTAGTATITYTLGTTCFRTKTITINAQPAVISGTASVCAGQTTTLADADAGVWSITGGSIATVGSGTGVVTGVSAGSTPVTFTGTATGCTITRTVTVNALSAISGLSSLCAGLTTTLSNAIAGGTWSSGTVSVATINTSGLLSALAPGTTVISYTLGSGCVATRTVTVISTPTAISGPSTACVGQATTLTDAGGGVWTSSTPGVATVGSSTGIVTGVTTGNTTITYSLGSGCTVTKPITVNLAASAISGTATVCAGASITLTDVGGGTWSSSNANATVGTTSGFVTGVTAGNAIISYTLATGCYATKTVTINPLPAAIAGVFSICTGANTTLTDATAGGTWTSSTVSVATITSTTGVATGLSVGVTNITYTLSGTGCKISQPVTVSATPAAIVGSSNVCVGANITLTDAGAGTWTSSNANAVVDLLTGVVTGASAGVSTITYTLGSGCYATRTESINALPVAISGTTVVCAGATTALSDGTPGGTWGSAAPGIATVGATTGVVSGVTTGTAVIAYTISGTGCAITTTVTVNTLPSAISGTMGVCLGSTTTLTDAGGGTWTSSVPTTASIGSLSGIVTGLLTGTATISYTLSTGCARTAVVTVNPLPAAIAGVDSLCTGTTTTLTDAGGGSWLSGSPLVATIGSSSGIVSGVASGTTVITYTLPTGCATNVTVTVHSSPSPISGIGSACTGDLLLLSDGTGGGTWSSSLPGVATIGSAGSVTTIAAGTTIISYTISTGCAATMALTVNPLPGSITGPAAVCPGAVITLVDAGGGTWTSSDVTRATTGSGTGVVTGVAAGTATITYTLATGCIATLPITVNPLPFAGGITGLSNVCVASSITLADTATGGIWISVTPAIATVSSTGIVTGVVAGVDTIRYSVTNSCGNATVSTPITVNPLPVAGTISGPSFVCMGSVATLTDPASGGVWSSSNTALATIGSATGVITTVAPGIVTISYSVTNICTTAIATKLDTIIALPAAGTIVGADSVCEGNTIALSNLATGGTWSVSNGNATVGSTGIVTGVIAGTDTVIYTVTTACGTATARLLMNVKSHAICNVGVQPVAVLEGVFKVYPNPSAGAFTVDIPQTNNGSVVMVTDVLGKVIETRNLTDNSAQKVIFNLNNLAAGSYIIKVNAGSVTYREKIVIW
jgi:uncharacterized protein YjdB